MSKLTGLLCISFCIPTIATLDRSHDDVIMATLAKLSTDISDLKQTVNSQRLELAEQGRKLTLLEAENERLKDSCANDKASSPDVSKRLLLMNQDHPTHTKAAFTARLSAHITGLGNLQTIKFEDVVTNIGSCYSPNTGTFTATSNGTYFFFASMMSHHNEYLESAIVKNGIQEALMYNFVPNAYDQGVNAVVLSLVVGDEVWVRHIRQEGSKVLGDTWSSFSGFQIE